MPVETTSAPWKWSGARSKIAEELGLPIEGIMGRAATIYTLFKADLTKYVAIPLTLEEQ